MSFDDVYQMSFEKDMKKHIICHIKNVIYVAYIYHGKDKPDGKQTKTSGT